MNKSKIPPVRVRVRFELSTFPTRKGGAITGDKRVTALQVLLQERFGAEGETTFQEWAAGCAQDQYKTTLEVGPHAR